MTSVGDDDPLDLEVIDLDSLTAIDSDTPGPGHASTASTSAAAAAAEPAPSWGRQIQIGIGQHLLDMELDGTGDDIDIAGLEEVDLGALATAAGPAVAS